MISVAATTNAGNRASYSNSGATVDIAAPGGETRAADFALIAVLSNQGRRAAGTYSVPGGQRHELRDADRQRRREPDAVGRAGAHAGAAPRGRSSTRRSRSRRRRPARRRPAASGIVNAHAAVLAAQATTAGPQHGAGRRVLQRGLRPLLHDRRRRRDHRARRRRVRRRVRAHRPPVQRVERAGDRHGAGVPLLHHAGHLRLQELALLHGGSRSSATDSSSTRTGSTRRSRSTSRCPRAARARRHAAGLPDVQQRADGRRRTTGSRRISRSTSSSPGRWAGCPRTSGSARRVARRQSRQRRRDAGFFAVFFAAFPAGAFVVAAGASATPRAPRACASPAAVLRAVVRAAGFASSTGGRVVRLRVGGAGAFFRGDARRASRLLVDERHRLVERERVDLVAVGHRRVDARRASRTGRSAPRTARPACRPSDACPARASAAGRVRAPRALRRAPSPRTRSRPCRRAAARGTRRTAAACATTRTAADRSCRSASSFSICARSIGALQDRAARAEVAGLVRADRLLAHVRRWRLEHAAAALRARAERLLAGEVGRLAVVVVGRGPKSNSTSFASLSLSFAENGAPELAAEAVERTDLALARAASRLPRARAGGRPGSSRSAKSHADALELLVVLVHLAAALRARHGERREVAGDRVALVVLRLRRRCARSSRRSRS